MCNARTRQRAMSFEQFQRAMVEFSQSYQGENYPGDAYYLQKGCWEDAWKCGDSPEEAVVDDMGYWE